MVYYIELSTCIYGVLVQKFSNFFREYFLLMAINNRHTRASCTHVQKEDIKKNAELCFSCLLFEKRVFLYMLSCVASS
jgi:hypothetical protein